MNLNFNDTLMLRLDFFNVNWKCIVYLTKKKFSYHSRSLNNSVNITYIVYGSHVRVIIKSIYK